MMILVTLVLAAGCFIFDVLTPLGTSKWGFYLIPVLLCWFVPHRRYPLYFAGLCSVLMLLEFFLSPRGPDPQWAIFTRGVRVAVYWLVAMLIVKRNSAETSGRISEQRLRAILDHSPMDIFVKDLSGRYVEFNHQCEISTGKKRAEVLGKTDAEVFPGETARLFVDSDQAALKSGKSFEGQVQIPQEDGPHTHLFVKFPLFDAQGRHNAICGISRDVTVLKQTEGDLHDNQERFELAQFAAGIGVFDWSLKDGQVLCSRPLEHLYGVGPGEFPKNYAAWEKFLHLEDRARVQEEVAASLAAQRGLNTEFRIVWPDGSVHWLRAISRFIRDESGEPVRMVGINIDITAQRQVQEISEFSTRRLEFLAQVTATVAGAAPLREEARKLAGQAMAAFGVDACAIRILEGGNLLLLASEGFPERALQPNLPANWGVSADIINSRRPIFIPDVNEHAMLRTLISWLPSEYRFLSYAGAPLLVQDEVVGIFGIFWRQKIQTAFSTTDLEHLQIVANHAAVAVANDRLFKEVKRQKDQLAEQMAERRRVEGALRENESVLKSLSRRLLELQEAERRHLARELHDEIGQALTALKINLQAAQNSNGDKNAPARLLDSVRIVDRTLQQVRNLSLDLRPSLLDDLGLCAALRWYTDNQAQRAGLHIQFAARGIDARLDPTVETACFRVAQEALTNIIRHAGAQVVLVDLSGEDGFLHLLVRDNGKGFDPDNVNRQMAGRTSMGLLGMKERVSLTHGRIEFKSAPGEGTEIHAWFPLTYAEQEPGQLFDFASK